MPSRMYRLKQHRMRTALGLLVLLILIGGVATAWAANDSGSRPFHVTAPQLAADSAAAPTLPAGAKPNVLFVLTDDMRFDDMQYLPHIKALIGDQGMTFDNEFDNVTLCCPARTSIIRGQYSHNTTVLTNASTNGGFETAYKNNVEQSTVATAAHDAGYMTALFGKYLNGYPNTADSAYIPPGWDGWGSSIKGNAYGEYDYTLNQDGKPVRYAHTPADYGTDVYTGLTKDFIDSAAKAHKPFFVYMAVYAPHQPATPAPQDEQAFPGLKALRDASYNEADVSDKPQFIQDLPLLSATQQKNIDNIARKRAQSLQEVDRSVAALIDELQANGQLANTYIIFTSDNGFHLGQHRMPSGKETAYESDIHLPLLVRGPGVTAGAHVSAITGNIDIAPTIAALCGGTMTDNPDGRSLVPFLLAKPSGAGIVPAPASWRQAYLLEHWSQTSTLADRTNASQDEPDDPDQGGVTPGDDTDPTIPPGKIVKLDKIEFQGIRVAGYTYVEYSTGEREFYDLAKIPDELTNTAKTADPALIAELHQRLNDLRNCSGDACRTAENKPIS